MPNDTVIKLSERLNKPVKDIESLWRRCKREASECGRRGDYVYTTKLLKERLGFLPEEKENSKVKQYKGFQVEVVQSTPDTALVKVKNPDNSELGKLIQASNNMLAVPIRELKETTGAMSVGNGPARAMGTMGSFKNGGKVKMRNGKQGVVTVYGTTYSLVSPLDSKGNPTGEMKKISNSLLRSINESKTGNKSLLEMAMEVGIGDIDADDAVDALIDDPMSPAEVIEIDVILPPEMEVIARVMQALGIEPDDVTDEQLGDAFAAVQEVLSIENSDEDYEEEDEIDFEVSDEEPDTLNELPDEEEIDDEDFLAEMPESTEEEGDSILENFQSNGSAEDVEDQENTDDTDPPAELSAEVDSVGDLDDSDLALVKETLSPEEKGYSPDDMMAPDATPNGDKPVIKDPPPMPLGKEDPTDTSTASLKVPSMESNKKPSSNLLEQFKQAGGTVVTSDGVDPEQLAKLQEQESVQPPVEQPVEKPSAALSEATASMLGAGDADPKMVDRFNFLKTLS